MDQSKCAQQGTTVVDTQTVWQEDHEIFDLVSALEGSEGPSRRSQQKPLHVTLVSLPCFVRERDDILFVAGRSTYSLPRPD